MYQNVLFKQGGRPKHHVSLLFNNKNVNKLFFSTSFKLKQQYQRTQAATSQTQQMPQNVPIQVFSFNNNNNNNNISNNNNNNNNFHFFENNQKINNNHNITNKKMNNNKNNSNSNNSNSSNNIVNGSGVKINGMNDNNVAVDIILENNKSDFEIPYLKNKKEEEGIEGFEEILQNRTCSKDALHAIDSITNDLDTLGRNIADYVVSKHPALTDIAQYYFLGTEGKRVRPLLIMLMGETLKVHFNIDDKNTSNKIRSLSEIVEMIHTASLIHDDVIDKASIRRGQKAPHVNYNSKMAILSGDFLLARASLQLAKLENHKVTANISTAIAQLVEGEFLQMKPTDRSNFDTYLLRSYLKTGSLIMNGVSSAATLLAQEAEITAENAAAGKSAGKTAEGKDVVAAVRCFGTHLGMAFQIVDDVLDVTGSNQSLGKPASVDMSLGLATAPLLFAMEAHPKLKPIIERKFSSPGDSAKALSMLEKSNGMELAKHLALKHCEKAIESIDFLKDSHYKEGLIEMAYRVVDRYK